MNMTFDQIAAIAIASAAIGFLLGLLTNISKISLYDDSYKIQTKNSFKFKETRTEYPKEPKDWTGCPNCFGSGGKNKSCGNCRGTGKLWSGNQMPYLPKFAPKGNSNVNRL